MKRITFCALLMTLFLLLGCESGSTKAEDHKTVFLTYIANLGKGFLDVFTSFSDMVGGVLGFNTNTKKSDIGKYFKRVHDTVSSTKTVLEKIVSDMKSKNNPNAEAAGAAVKKLVSETLSKIIEGAKTASEAIGDAAKLAKNSAGIAASGVAAPKDTVMAGRIALRAMTKGGKFANGSNAADAKKIVEGVAVSAITKALDILTIAIKKNY